VPNGRHGARTRRNSLCDMASCVRSGELGNQSVTGPAAGEGEGRSASAVSLSEHDEQNGASRANRYALAPTH